MQDAKTPQKSIILPSVLPIVTPKNSHDGKEAQPGQQSMSNVQRSATNGTEFRRSCTAINAGDLNPINNRFNLRAVLRTRAQWYVPAQRQPTEKRWHFALPR